MSQTVFTPLVTERILHARTRSLSIRYAQSLVASLHTDSMSIWTEDDRALVLLLDSNLLEPAAAADLRRVVEAQLESAFAGGLDLHRCYRDGHEAVSGWLDRHGIRSEHRFVSAGLIQFDGAHVSYLGAYSPIYVHCRENLEQMVFDGPVWGTPASAGYPGRVGRCRLGPHQSLLVLSDGMLESRNRVGRINGDSVLYAWSASDPDAERDPLEAVLAGYRDADAERIDSYGLLVVQPATPAGPVRDRDERTLTLFKPDVYELGMCEEIMARLASLGMRTVERFQVRFPPEGVFYLWPRIYGRRWIESLQRSLPARPLDVLVLEGQRAIDRMIEFKDALREDRAPVNSYRNLLHSPDSTAAVNREYAYLDSIRLEAGE